MFLCLCFSPYYRVLNINNKHMKCKKIVFALIKRTTCLISELNDVTVAISLSKRKVIIVFGMVPI